MPCFFDADENEVYFFMPKATQGLPLSISQNFLTGGGTIERLLATSDIDGNDLVLEIGAGKGHITKRLSPRCRRVLAYELDRRLYAHLAPQLPANVELRCGDFLRAELPAGSYKVFANIPFSRTTEILRKLTEASNPPGAMWLVVERGAAKRFCGLPRESTQSLLLKPFYQTRIAAFLRREDFHPAPRVEAALLELKRKDEPDIPWDCRGAYKRFIQRGLREGFSGSHGLLTHKQVSTALRLDGLPPIKPSGQMLYVQWLCLFRCWQRYGRH